eukprot:RCo026422
MLDHHHSEAIAWSLVTIASAALGFMLYYLQPILIPYLIALMLSCIFHPVVAFLATPRALPSFCQPHGVVSPTSTPATSPNLRAQDMPVVSPTTDGRATGEPDVEEEPERRLFLRRRGSPTGHATRIP